MEPVIIVLVMLIVLAAAIVVARTLRYSRPRPGETLEFRSDLPPLALDPAVPARHLSKVIQIQTVSYEDPEKSIWENFDALHNELAATYPRVHAALTRQLLDKYSLLYTWQGSDPTLDPVIFMAHQDVVPADENTLSQWTHPPFSGEIAEGYIWGRGALDIKCQLISIFEAVEALLERGYRPERTVILAFSHDEEVLGFGARKIVSHLKEKGIHVVAVLDEGTSVLDGVLPGFSGLTAPIGITEKGYLSLKLTVKAAGGHSSTPEHETAIGILSRAIDRLQSNPFPYRLKAAMPMFKALTPAASPILKVAFANTWLLGGLIERKLAASSETAAAIHTTVAPTIFHSGVKDNVLPGLAEAVVNFRILPGETVAEVIDRVKSVVNDERVTYEPLRENAWEPSPVSPVDSPAYRHLLGVTAELFPGVTCAPTAMLGATDSRHFYAVSAQVYRFTPLTAKPEDLDRIHGINERISITDLVKMVDFFYRLIPRWTSTEM